jgi:protein arginine kinase
VTLDRLLKTPCQWLRPDGPQADIVLSTRVRLARNIAGRAFSSRLAADERADLKAQLKAVLAKAAAALAWFDLEGMSDIDRWCLVERHLISRELAAGEGARGVAVDPTQRIAVMAGEEDHLRLQVIESGLQVQEAFRQADDLDNRIEHEVPFAFSPALGYLTACPTNVGTGLRASVMLHLPGLVLTRQIEKVFRAVARLRLTVRGLYGEGTQATGDVYQISNQVTLGRAEPDILKNLETVIPQILQYEKQAREALVSDSPTPLDDKIFRAWGLLTNARTISSEETLVLLSAVRLGVHLGRLRNVDITAVNELFLLTRPGHIQKLHGRDLSEAERDVARAEYIRQRLGTLSNA